MKFRSLEFHETALPDHHRTGNAAFVYVSFVFRMSKIEVARETGQGRIQRKVARARSREGEEKDSTSDVVS